MKLTGKAMAVAIAIFLTLTMALSLVAVPLANAHDPPWTIPTVAYIEVSPDPIGVGQSVFVVMWLNKPPPTAGGTGGDRWTGFMVKVTDPNGDTENLGPFISDPTSSAYTTYTPDITGTYTFDFTFPGQVVSLYHPETGQPADPSLVFFGMLDFVNDTFTGSSASATLTVQDNPVEEPPSYPLPTQYWTRPIEGQNTAWFKISSNYIDPMQAAYGYGANRFLPDGTAPNSPHIMWTKPLDDGGIVGGTYEFAEGMSYYTGLSYESRFSTPLIIYGRLYYDTPLSDDPDDGPYVCVDLRTGETLWENPDISPTFGQLYMYDSPNQHGVVGDGYLWQTSQFGARWDAYDPRTGEWIFAMTDVPSGTQVYGPNGEITRYVLDLNNDRLLLWNTSATPTGPLVRTPGYGTDAFQYRPVGRVANMSDQYTWNVSIPDTIPDGSSILKAIPGDLLLGATTTTSGFFGIYTGSVDWTTWAISLKPGTRGNLLWMKNYKAPANNLTQQFGPVDAETRVFTMNIKENFKWYGYDLDSGNLVWGPSGNPRPFNYYPTIGMGGSGQAGFVAYGNLYVGGYGGEYICYSMENGDELWRYNNTYSAHETPWGNYPIFPAAICDGKIYLYSGEHSPNNPLYKGSRVRCINATTGEEIWTLLSWGTVGGFSDQGFPIADGFMVYLNAYDMQIYCIGKGPSATTVMASPKVSANGDTVLIEGMVTDESAGAKAKVASGEFDVVPAVSDDSMGPWMEFIYMQKPCPQDVQGVDVLVQTLDPNGNFYDVGTATTDASGMYSLTWEPPVPGKYTITARFLGSESYWTSYGQTALAVTEASPTPPPEEPLTLPPTDMYILVATIVIVLAIFIVGILLYRRH